MVDKSLSRGLADRVLDEMSGLARGHRERCRAIFRAIPERRPAVRAVAQALKAAGEAGCLTQVIAAHPLTLHEHAIERLFQRLNVMDAAAVRDEMHDAMLLSLPVVLAARHLGHRQAVLPTRSGTFLCSFDPERGGLLANCRDRRGLPVLGSC